MRYVRAFLDPQGFGFGLIAIAVSFLAVWIAGRIRRVR